MQLSPTLSHSIYEQLVFSFCLFIIFPCENFPQALSDGMRRRMVRGRANGPAPFGFPDSIQDFFSLSETFGFAKKLIKIRLLCVGDENYRALGELRILRMGAARNEPSE